MKKVLSHKGIKAAHLYFMQNVGAQQGLYQLAGDDFHFQELCERLVKRSHYSRVIILIDAYIIYKWK